MTICPIALAVGCEKCPAFKFCPLTTVLGDQQKEDEVNSSNDVSKWTEKDWEENSPTADEHLDQTDEREEKIRLTKDERLALIKESAEKKSFDERLRNRGR